MSDTPHFNSLLLEMRHPGRPRELIQSVVTKSCAALPDWLQTGEAVEQCADQVLQQLPADARPDAITGELVHAGAASTVNGVYLDALSEFGNLVGECEDRGVSRADAWAFLIGSLHTGGGRLLSRPGHGARYAIRSLILYYLVTYGSPGRDRGTADRPPPDSGRPPATNPAEGERADPVPVASAPDVEGRVSLEDATRDVSERLIIGDTEYPLKHRPTFHHSSRVPGVVELHAAPPGPAFVGRGATGELALGSWKEQIHVAFQRLCRKRPFEMTEEERDQWAALERFIDVGAYKARRPLVLRQLGRVRAVSPDPYEVEWIDNRRETVTLAAMPAAFAALGPGQWFEATVERDRSTWQLRKVLDLHPVDPIRPLTPEQVAEFVAESPPDPGSPTPVRDWTTR